MTSEAVTVIQPAGDPAPAVFDSPHSGDEFPDDFGTVLSPSTLRSGWDAYIDELFGAAPANGATLIAAQFPRTYIDPNRALEDLDAAMIAGDWPEALEAGPKTVLGHGLIWRKAGGKPIYDRKLTVDEIRNRIDRYWRPYNAAVRQAVDTVHAKWGGVWHVNCHSMGSVWGAGNPGAGEKVASDFLLGDRDGTTCAGEFTEFVRAMLTDMGYKVAVNDRFKGVQIVQTNGRPADNRHSLQIEIVRTRYMDEKTWQRTSDFATIKADLDKLVAAVCDFARERTA